MSATYVERAFLFGEDESLFGILSSPAEAAAVDGPAVVMLNTGTAHRIGHHRMYVGLARALAAHGYFTLRFDFAGIGDSRPSESGAPLLESNLADIRAALDWLEKRLQLRHFVLVGLCSGADYAVMYSNTDRRVVGLALLDPYVPKTFRYVLGYVLFRLSRPLNVLRFRPGKSLLMRTIYGSLFFSSQETSSLQHISFRGEDAHATLESIYAADVAAGMQFLVLCTGSDFSPRQTYEQQFVQSFKNVDFGAQLQVRFLRDSDHLFSSPSSRQAFEDLTVAWLASAPFMNSTSKAPDGDAEAAPPTP